MKRHTYFFVLVGVVALLSCSGESPTPSPLPTPPNYTWTITLTATDHSPQVGDAVTILATVNRNGSITPDATSVEFLTNSGQFINGTTVANVMTVDGIARIQHTASEASSCIVQAQVYGHVKQVTLVFHEPDVNNDLEIYNVNPRAGSLAGGMQVVLEGKGILPPVEVRFDGLYYGWDFSAEIVDVTVPTSVTLLTPYAATISNQERENQFDIVVTSGVGTSYAQTVRLDNAFTYLRVTDEPEIYGMTPNRGGSAGGELVAVNGANFLAPIRVLLGGHDVTETTLSADGTQIEFLTPEYSTTPTTSDHLVNVSVYSEWGTARENLVSMSGVYTYVADNQTPDIDHITPATGPLTGGTEVTILGHGFEFPVDVHFGNLAGTVIDLTDDTSVADNDVIHCVTPDFSQSGQEAPVSVNVQVTNMNTGLYSYYSAFTFGEILYVSGNDPAEGGRLNLVNIYGNGFEDPLYVDLLTGPGYRLEDISVSGSLILARLPADIEILPDNCVDATSPGLFRVTLIESGTVADGGSFRLLGDAPTLQWTEPQIVSAGETYVNPTSIVLKGHNFIEPVRVSFGSTLGIGGYVMPSSGVDFLDDTTINITGLPAPSDFAMSFNTTGCVSGDGQAGTIDIPTSVEVTVINLRGPCVSYIEDYLTYEPVGAVCVVAPVITPIPAALVFPDTQYDPACESGGSGGSLLPLTIQNQGGGDLTIQNIVIAGPFSFYPVQPPATPLTLAPFAQLPLQVRFCPTFDDGLTYAGQVVIVSDDPVNPSLTVPLSGNEALVPDINTSPLADGENWYFPVTAATNCSASDYLTISNLGDGDLTVTALVSLPFDMVTAPVSPVAPGLSTTVEVQFCPTDDNNITQLGTLTIDSDDPDEPQIVINLEGDEDPS